MGAIQMFMLETWDSQTAKISVNGVKKVFENRYIVVGIHDFYFKI
jgi:hypothetical protein